MTFRRVLRLCGAFVGFSLSLAACSESSPQAGVGPSVGGGAGGKSGASGIGGTGGSAIAGATAMSGSGGTATGGSAGETGGASGEGGSGATSGFAGASIAGAGGNPDAGAGGSSVAGTAGTPSAGSAGSPSGGNAGSGGAGGSGPRPTVTPAPGTTLVKVNPGVRRQTFEGWGTSLCWWADRVGGWSESARNAVVDAIVDPVSGLGYNVFRYNIGGGENPAHTHMEEHKDIPGFQSSSGTWNWNADANQRAVLQRIVLRGSGVVLEAFSNSPPYWMTKSGCASGNTDGSNNLKDDSYDAFAEYLTEVVKHYKDTYGITFRTLEPLNEPNANWWTSNGKQEGCHFSPSNQQTIIRAVAAKLTAKGLTGTTVSASDENSMDDAYNNMRAFDTTTWAALSQMNVHSYAGSRRADVLSLATMRQKRLWQSESGPLGQTLADDTAAAIFMAGRIITDLRDLRPAAWVDWQVGDVSRNWASFALNDAQQNFTYLRRFYMHANFSRYIRPGATFIDIDNAEMVAAVSADGATLAIVVRNGDTSASRGFTFDLTALPAVGAAVDAFRTSRSENLASLADLPIQNYSFVATVPAGSITTFVMPMR